MAGIGTLLGLLSGAQQSFQHAGDTNDLGMLYQKLLGGSGSPSPSLLSPQASPPPPPQPLAQSAPSFMPQPQPQQQPPQMQPMGMRGNFIPGVGWNPTPVQGPSAPMPQLNQGMGSLQPPAPPPPMQQQPSMPQPMPQQDNAPQGGMPGQDVTWQGIIQTLKQVNPNATGREVSAIVDQMTPFMSAQSQNQWKMMQLMLRDRGLDQGQERIQNTAEYQKGRLGQGEERIGISQQNADTRSKGEKRLEDKPAQGAKNTDSAELYKAQSQVNNITKNLLFAPADQKAGLIKDLQYWQDRADMLKKKVPVESLTKVAEPNTAESNTPSQEDLEYTAKQNGITVDEVKKRLGIE